MQFLSLSRKLLRHRLSRAKQPGFFVPSGSSLFQSSLPDLVTREAPHVARAERGQSCPASHVSRRCTDLGGWKSEAHPSALCAHTSSDQLEGPGASPLISPPAAFSHDAFSSSRTTWPLSLVLDWLIPFGQNRSSAISFMAMLPFRVLPCSGGVLEHHGVSEVTAGRLMSFDLSRICQRTCETLQFRQSFHLSQDWGAIYSMPEKSHTWDQWYAVDYTIKMAGIPVDGASVLGYLLYVDGCHFRSTGTTVWYFVVVTEHHYGYALQGYVCGPLSEMVVSDCRCTELDNIFGESISIMYALT